MRSAADSSYLGPADFCCSGAAVITATWAQTGDDSLGHVFTFDLTPGATKRLATFLYRGLAEGTPGPVDGGSCGFYPGGCTTPLTGTQSSLAQNVLAGLVAAPPLCDLSPVERASLVNWPWPAAICGDVFLPIFMR